MSIKERLGDETEATRTRIQANYSTRYTNFASLNAAVQHRWQWLLESLGVPGEALSRRHGPCPACGGSDRFRFDDKEGRGTFFCNNCGAGDGFNLLELVHGWDSKTVLQRVREALGGVRLPPISLASQKKEEDMVARAKRKDRLNRIWSASKRLHPGSIAWTYFAETRGIPVANFPDSLREHEDLNFWETGSDGKPRNRGKYPALVALITGAGGKPAGLHLTYLTVQAQKLERAGCKKMLSAFPGALSGGCIRLGEPVEVLAICEGIETGLALMQTLDSPVWATGSAVLLEKVLVPESVKRVLVFADNDSNGRGQTAARIAAERFKKSGRSADIYIPDLPDTDWLDQAFGG